MPDEVFQTSQDSSFSGCYKPDVPHISGSFLPSDVIKSFVNPLLRQGILGLTVVDVDSFSSGLDYPQAWDYLGRAGFRRSSQRVWGFVYFSKRSFFARQLLYTTSPHRSVPRIPLLWIVVETIGMGIWSRA